jgi:hypothetical protein
VRDRIRALPATAPAVDRTRLESQEDKQLDIIQDAKHEQRKQSNDVKVYQAVQPIVGSTNTVPLPSMFSSTLASFVNRIIHII